MREIIVLANTPWTSAVALCGSCDFDRATSGRRCQDHHAVIPACAGNADVVTPEVALSDVRIRNVLVPLDGSEFALQAMPTARALADRLGSDVHTISVAGTDEHAGHLRALASGALDVDMDDDRVVVVSNAEPADAIERRARELDPCVVCLTTHGRGRLRGAFIGSVARSLVQRSSDPIVALGPMADNPGWSPRPRRWPEPLSVPRIVACVDGTDTSEQVLPLAASWAKALEMSLTILTVIADEPPPIRPPRNEGRYGAHGDAETYIEQLVQEWRTSLLDTDGDVVRGPTGLANAIRAHLDQRPAGLVAVTTHARSGMQRVLFGAAAASIVHASVAPCLVAPVR
jgi:nucleotide-binding universal stress UspA family protein